MINNVLDFARLSAGKDLYHLTETDLRATVATILEHYGMQFEEHGVRLEISLQEQLSPVAHDPHGVTQILLNLLDNAVKYAASGRVVQVRLTRDTLLAEVWGHPQDIVTRTVDNFILRLRKKIEPDPAHPRHLPTVHGSGYKLVA